MEGKIIIGIISAFIMVITASFLNSENLSKTQKVILFILIIFPPVQWFLGLFFINLNKKKLKTKKSQIANKTKEECIVLNKKTEGTPIKISNKNDTTREIFNEKIELLKKSLEMNLISKTEFDSKRINIENEKKRIEKEEREAEKEIRNSEKLEKSKNTLKKLYEANIITKEEFNLKIQEQKDIVYGIEKDTSLKIESNDEYKNTSNDKYIVFSVLIGFVLLIFVALNFIEPTNHEQFKPDLYYENQIQFFLTAETQENILEVTDYFDLNNVSRCWTVLNPSYDELKNLYQKRWRETSHTTLSINSIEKKQTKMFEANIDYQLYNEEEQEWKDSNRTIRFVFGQSNKIIEIYELN